MHEFNSTIFIWFLNILLIISVLILFFSLYNTSRMNAVFKKDNISKIQGIPTPMMIIDIANNTISSINSSMLDLLEMPNMEFNDLSHLNIFQKFEDYIELKKDCKFNPHTHTKNINIYTHKNKELIVEARYNYFEIGCKKYMTLVFNNKSEHFNYIRSLGVFASIIEKSPDGIIITRYIKFGEPPIILYANQSITDITGYSQKELIGKPIHNLFALNVNDKTLKCIEKNIYSLKPNTIEYQYIQKNGELSWVESNIIPINNINIKQSIKLINQIQQIESEHNNDVLTSNNEIFITIHQKNKTKEKLYETTSKTFIDKLNTEVKEKTKYCNILTNTLYNLITIDSKKEAIEKVLKIINEFLEIDRSCVFEIYEKEEKTFYNLLYESVKTGTKSDLDNKNLHYSNFNDIGGYELYTNLKSNRLFSYNKNSENKLPLIAEDSTYQVQSLLISPIFYKNTLVGFLSICDCKDNERKWEPEAENLIKELSNVLGYILIKRT